MNLQNYLTQNKGENLKKIDPDLKIIEINHKINKRTLEILCHKNLTPVGISFDEDNIQEHLEYMPAGLIYFISQKISNEIYNKYKNQYNKGKLKFFEYTYSDGECFFEEMKGKQLITAKKETLEVIASTLVDMLPRRYSNLKKAYRLISHLK